MLSNSELDRLAVSTKQFTIDGEHKEFISEFSDIEKFQLSRLELKEYFSATANSGFVLKSSATGVYALFLEVDRKVQDGELQYVTYKPSKEAIAVGPKLSGWVLRVFND